MLRLHWSASTWALIWVFIHFFIISLNNYVLDNNNSYSFTLVLIRLNIWKTPQRYCHELIYLSSKLDLTAINIFIIKLECSSIKFQYILIWHLAHLSYVIPRHKIGNSTDKRLFEFRIKLYLDDFHLLIGSPRPFVALFWDIKVDIRQARLKMIDYELTIFQIQEVNMLNKIL